MKHIGLLFLLFYLVLPEHTLAQIKLPEKEKPKASSRTREVKKESTSNVLVTWKSDYNAIIVIGDKEYDFAGFQTKSIEILSDKSLELYAKLPGKKYYALEYLLIKKEPGYLEVKISGDNLSFTYETKRERDARSA